MSIQPHRRASEEYQDRVDARLEEQGLAHFTSIESQIVDEWSCLDFREMSCADYIAKQRAKSATAQ